MDDQQKADFLSFIHDDGKGFIGVHSATITFTKWPEYGEMMGGYFDEHPWGTFDAPILVEDAAFPGMKQWAEVFHPERRDLSGEELLARKHPRADAPRPRQAGPGQSEGASQGQ